MNPLLRFSGLLRKNERATLEQAPPSSVSKTIAPEPCAPEPCAAMKTDEKAVTQNLSSTRCNAQRNAQLEPIGGVRKLPCPALRWVGDGGRTALRVFHFAADADAVCAWQKETYTLNFPDFRYTDSFASAFRHDLRRAALDPHHGIFVLDEGELVGFLWLVICENSWTGERYGYVNNLYIAPLRRGFGLSREMMTHAEKWFRDQKIKRARLTVTTSNQSACALYEKCGYNTTRWEMEKEL